MKVKIVTDSGSDLPKSIIEKYDISVLPLCVYLDNKEYEDDVTIHSMDVMKHMEAGKHPHTGQVPYSRYYDVFSKFAKDNTSMIYISFSSGLSGTIGTAELVVKDLKVIYPKLDITIVDSKCATLGQGLLVMEAAKMAEMNKTTSEISDWIESNKSQVEHIYTIPDLKYLYRGGRLNKTQYTFGSALKINVLLGVEDGKIIPKTKVRGNRKAQRKMLDYVVEKVKPECEIIFINHGNDYDTAKKLEEQLRAELEVEEIIICNVGCAIGVHTGPGFVGMFFWGKEIS